MKKTAFLSLGSNIGDRIKNLNDAITRIAEHGEVLRVSSFYETEPVEFLQQPWFMNCVAELATEKMPRALLAAMLQVERAMGRRRNQAKGPRTIDIDIVLYGRSLVSARGLEIPHPAMHERRFVLEPLAEIAPGAVHPGLRRTVAELLAELRAPAGQAVKRISSQE